MVMHDSQARPPLAALISCSGVEKSPGSPLRLFTMMSGCSSNTILFIFSDSQPAASSGQSRSEEHTSELQSPCNLVCRLLLEKKKTTTRSHPPRLVLGTRVCSLRAHDHT